MRAAFARVVMQRVITGAAILALAQLTTAQSPVPQRPPDVFRAGVELVEVDVIVTDRQGRPVRGLTRDDFDILEDGKRVEMASFQPIELPEGPRPAATSSPAVSGSAIADNLKSREGSIYLILFGDAGSSFSAAHFQRARRVVLALLDRFGPADQVAMMATSGHRAYQVEFTTDRDRLARALERPVLGLPTMEKLVPDLLMRVSRQLAAIPHRRKVIALVSEGFVIDEREPEFLLAFDEARRANVAVYTFDPKFSGSLDGMIGAESPQDLSDLNRGDRESVTGLRTLADYTGGRATVRTNFLAEGVDRMVDENRSYYLLRYYSTAPQDGKYHTIAVKTRQPGLEVRSRPGYTSAKAGMKPPPSAPAPLARLAGAPIQTHGLDSRVVAVPVPSAARSGSALAIVTEVRVPDLSGAPAFELTALAVDMSGRVRARDDYKAAVALVKEDARWLRVALRLDVPAGRYQVRVAARRTDGSADGSVFLEVEVPKFSQDLSLGGLTLGTPGTRGVARADRIAGVLPATPIAAAEVPAGMTISAVLPLRVAAKHRGRQIAIVARLVTSDGSISDLHQLDRPASDFTGPAGGVIEIPVPTRGLAAGEYRLRVEIGLATVASQTREVVLRVATDDAGG